MISPSSARAEVPKVYIFVFDDAFPRALSARIVPLVPAGVTPNQVTILSGLCWAVAGGALYLASFGSVWLAVAAAAIFAGWLLDYVDGDLARARGLTSERGCFLDRMVDTASMLAVYLGLAFASYTHGAIIIAMPICDLVQDLVTAQWIYFRGQHIMNAAGPVAMYLQLLLPLVLTAIWSGPVVMVAGVGLGWFDLVFLVAIVVTVFETGLSATRLYRELAPPAPR